MFSKRLKYLRKRKKLSQQNIADYLGITRQGYGKYEDGKSEPDHKTLLVLASCFGVTTDYLLGYSNDPDLSKEQEEELEELNRIIESLPEEKRKEISDQVLAYAKFLTDASKE